MNPESMVLRQKVENFPQFLEFDQFRSIYGRVIDLLTLFFQINPVDSVSSPKLSKNRFQFIVPLHHQMISLFHSFCSQYNIDFYLINLSELLLDSENGLKKLREELQNLFINDLQDKKEIQIISENIIPDNNDHNDQENKQDITSIPEQPSNESNERIEVSKKTQPKLIVLPLDQYESELNTHDNLFLYRMLTEIFSSNLYSCNGKLIILSSPTQILPVSFFNEFDLKYQIDYPSLKERKEFLYYYLLSSWESELNLPNSDLNTSIDFEHLAQQVDKWNFGDIQSFINYSYWIWRMESLSLESGKLKYDTIFLINQIENYVKSYLSNSSINVSSPRLNPKEIESSESSLSSNRDDNIFSTYQRDLESSLYQDIVLDQYDDLLLTLDKLNKGLILDQKDRHLLSDYPFVLRDSPEKAMQKMHKAKTRMDRIYHLNSKK